MQPHSVRSILAGDKTMTRRVIKNQPPPFVDCHPQSFAMGFDASINPATTTNCHFTLFGSKDATRAWELGKRLRCPYGKPGDLLWVRETWFCATGSVGGGPDLVHYRADARTELLKVAQECGLWKPSIHMPHWASRITLRIGSVKVERLQDISEEDAVKEGIDAYQPFSSAVEEFSDLWDSINAKTYPWSSNCWVWAIEFERVKP